MPYSETRSKSLKGRHTSPRTEFKLGHQNLTHKGIKRTPAQCDAMSKARFGKKNPDHSDRIKALWKTAEYAAKQHLGRKKGPNKSENGLNALLQILFPGKYLFTGDFSFMVDGKNPDFVSTEGSKKIIELFGDRYHDEEEAEKRTEFFKLQGYETLIVWNLELRDLAVLIEKLKRFHVEGRIA